MSEIRNDRICKFSTDRVYRYTLWRDLDMFGKGLVQFIGLNPSTADETSNDPTVRRCMGFAESWGYKTMCMTNLFAFRATDPNVMKAHPEPVGEHNLRWLKAIALEADLVVCAWGNDGAHLNQAHKFLQSMVDWPREIKLHCLARNLNGYPKHPLYVAGACEPQPFNFTKL